MQIKIYQINRARDKSRVKFCSLEDTLHHQGNAQVDASLYDEVFSGIVDCSNLEGVYNQFNTTGHPLHRGHSLSVSDIVVNESGAYFCNNFDFELVPFNQSLTQKPSNLLKIVYVEPHKEPYIAEIENTLKASQKAVGGYIQTVYNDDKTMIVCNEEAKLCGMEGNRRIGDSSTIIAGSFFVVGVGGENFKSLTDKKAQKYMEMFADPEEISQEETEADIRFSIRPW